MEGALPGQPGAPPGQGGQPASARAARPAPPSRPGSAPLDPDWPAASIGPVAGAGCPRTPEPRAAEVGLPGLPGASGHFRRLRIWCASL